MNLNIKYFVITVFLFQSLFSLSYSKEEVKLGIYEQLGAQIPMDLEFDTAEGEKKKLSEIITKPTILSLVYYHCPGICSPLLSALGKVIDKVEMTPQKDFNVLTISFDHKETYKDAAKWKKNYLSALERNFPDDSWTFMTGDSISIKKLADAVGFHFIPEGTDDFTHAGSLIVLSPEGKVSRYLFGSEFLPFDLKMAILEAGRGESNPTISKMLQFCYSYDPEGETYVFNFTKVFGTLMFLGIGIFFSVLLVKGRSKKNRKGFDNVVE